MKKKIYYAVKTALMIAVPACIFYYLFKRTGLGGVIQEIQDVNILIVLAAVMISVLNNILLTALRWKKILDKIGYHLPYRKVLFIKMGSEPFVGLFPVKTGEFSRAVYLKKMDDVDFDDAVFSIGIGYILNFVVLIGFMVIGGTFVYFTLPKGVLNQAKILFPVCAFSQAGQKIKGWLSRLCSQKGLESRVRKHLCHARIVGCDWQICFFSVVIWLTELLNFYLLSISLGSELPFLHIVWVLPAVIIISHVPISIAGLGIREWLIFLWFAPYASPERLLTLGILYSLVENIFPIIFGGLATGHFVERLLVRKHSCEGGQ